MAQGTTTFPTTLDSERSNPSNMDTSEAALLAMQAKIGADGSTVTTSHDYKIEHEKIVTITGDGAITIQRSAVALTKGSAAAITLAAPTAAQAGTIVRIVAGSAFAHVVTATGLIDDGVTGGSKTTATFGAFVGASLTLMAYNLKWVVLSKNVCTIT
jgi:hypothetical protein